MRYTLAIFALITFVAAADEKYITKYDNLDLETALESDRLFRNYFNCLMDEGRCTPDGNEMKKNFPEIFKNGCAKCNAKQKSGSIIIIKFMIEKKPEHWKKVLKKYNPDGVNTYENFLEKLMQS